MGILKSMREAAGLTVRDMSRDVSVSEETYMRWEQGDIRGISQMQAIRLAHVFGITDWYLFLSFLEESENKNKRRIVALIAWAALTLVGHIALLIRIFTK
jgi:transcriptional regulator with XRE-family HTH domain